MPLRCPVCRAETAAGTTCRRCKADLSLVAQIEAEREFRLRQVAEHLRAGSFDDALNELDLAQELRADHDIHRLRACVFALANDFESAFTEHAKATSA